MWQHITCNCLPAYERKKKKQQQHALVTLVSSPDTTVCVLQWNVPWVYCGRKFDNNVRIDLFGTNNAFIHDAGHTWGHGRSSQVTELTLRENSFEMRILCLDRYSPLSFVEYLTLQYLTWPVFLLHQETTWYLHTRTFSLYQPWYIVWCMTTTRWESDTSVYSASATYWLDITLGASGHLHSL